MHKIDRGIRLEQIAPCALAGIRFAGNQKNAKLIAHAVDVDDGAIVDRRKLAGQRGRFDFDDIRSAMRDRDINALRRTNRNRARFHDLAVAADRHHGAPLVGALILNLIGDGLRLANNAEARCGNQGNAAVSLILDARDQRMNRRRKAECAGVRRHIVDASVRDHDRSGNAVGGNVRERRSERGK